MPVTSNEQFRSDLPTTGISVGEPYPEGGYPSPDAAAPDYQDFPPPPQAPLAPPLSTSAAGSADQPSSADVAKDQAASVAGGAADAAQHVAGVAKDQVGQIAAEGGRQARQLLGQAQSELSDQAQVQQERVVSGLRAMGDQLSSMAASSLDKGVATDLARQAAEKAHQVAGWLDQRDPGSVLEEVRAFARQRPGAFLAIALGAGVVTGRLVRGLTAGSEASGSTGSVTSGATGHLAVDSAARYPQLDVPPLPASGGTAAGGDPLGGRELFTAENPYRAGQTDWTDLPGETSDNPR